MIGRRCKRGNAFSRPVLIGRGLELFARARYGLFKGYVNTYACLSVNSPVSTEMVSGGHGGGDTPVPIPNTAVKPARADGTWGETPWESRSSPEYFSKPPARRAGGFLFLHSYFRKSSLLPRTRLAPLAVPSGGQPSRTSSFSLWLHHRAIRMIAALQLLRGRLQTRVRRDEIPRDQLQLDG